MSEAVFTLEGQAPPPLATLTLWRHMEVIEGGHMNWPDPEACVHWLGGGLFYGFADGPLKGYVAPFKSPVPKFLKVGIQVGQNEGSVTYKEVLYRRDKWIEPCHQMWRLEGATGEGKEA